MKTSLSGGLKNCQEVISSRRRQNSCYMKTSPSGGLQDCQKDISSRRLQNYFYKDLIVGRIARSPRDHHLKAISIWKDSKIAKRSSSQGDINKVTHLKTSSSGG